MFSVGSKASQYAQKVEAYWTPLMEQAATLYHTAFAETFLERGIEIPKGMSRQPVVTAAPIHIQFLAEGILRLSVFFQWSGRTSAQSMVTG